MALYTFSCKDCSSDNGSWQVLIIAKTRKSANKALEEYLLLFGRPKGYDVEIECIVNERFVADGVIYSCVESR